MNAHSAANARAIPAEEFSAPRAVSEQLALNRAAVAFAEDAPTRDALDAAGWQRRGFLQRLSRRPRLREVK